MELLQKSEAGPLEGVELEVEVEVEVEVDSNRKSPSLIQEERRLQYLHSDDFDSLIHVAPLPMSEVQSNYLAAVVTGRVSLPSRADREKWLVGHEKMAWEQRGVDPASRKVHYMNHIQWPYLKLMLRKAGGAGTLLSRTNGMKSSPPWWTEESLRDAQAKPVKYIHEGKAGEVNEEDLQFVDMKPRLNGSFNPEQNERDMKTMVEMLELREVMYDDAAESWSPFPGGDDDYRRRIYEVDWQKGSYKVYMSPVKANGERPLVPQIPEVERPSA